VQSGIEEKHRIAIRTRQLTVLTKFQIHVRVVLRGRFTNAFERFGADADFSDAEIVAELWNSSI